MSGRKKYLLIHKAEMKDDFQLKLFCYALADKSFHGKTFVYFGYYT